MLKRIYINNYRTLVNFEWKPPAVCVLVGENGAGKSSLLEVLCLLQDVLLKGATFAETGFPSTCTEWLKEPEQTIEVELEHEGESFQYRLGYREENGRGAIRENLSVSGSLLYSSGDGKVELFGDPPTQIARTSIPYDRRRSFIAALEPRPDNRRIVSFRQAIESIWIAKPDPRKLGAAADLEAPWLERDFSNFANWYRACVGEDPDATEALRKDLQRAIVGFDQLRLVPVTPEVKDLRVRFSFGKKAHELSWAKLSDGQRLIIALYGFFRFAFSRASVFALDEIENYVAPSEIQPWLRFVIDAAVESDRQILVISHHPESINYLAADAVWRLWRDPSGGHTRIALLEPDRDSGETAYDLVKQGSPDA